MNKNILWAVIGVVALVLIVAGIAVTLQRSGDAEVAVETESGQVDDSVAIEQRSFRELALSGRSSQCQFTDPQSGATGALYIGGGKMRADFSSEAGGMTITGHMVSDSQTAYVWVEGMTNGFKMALDTTVSGSSTSTREQVDLDQKVDVRCQDWSVDQTKFELPTTVQFNEMASIDSTTADSADTRTDRCASCDTAPAEYRDQCRQALGC